MSQCADILAVLEDGEPHTVAEIHRRAGYSRLNSRVSELRARGYRIECRHIPGLAGTDAYEYTLIGALDAAPETSPLPPDVGGAASSAPGDPERDYMGAAPCPAAAGVDDAGSPGALEQLTLIGAV